MRVFYPHMHSVYSIKDAIAQGYVQLSKRMDSIIGDSLDD